MPTALGDCCAVYDEEFACVIGIEDNEEESEKSGLIIKNLRMFW